MHAKMYSRLYSIGSDSGRVSFWGDAYTVRKWTRNLRKKNRKCVPTKRIEKRMPECRISKEPFRFREIKCSQTMHASMCSRHVLFGTTESRFFFFFAYAVRIASVILRTARFLCVPYAEICVNATTAPMFFAKSMEYGPGYTRAKEAS